MCDSETAAPSDAGLNILCETIVGEVRLDEDLTLRRIAVLLTVYQADVPQTVRGLAAHLQVQKPAITRALDLLGKHDLVRRRWDPKDRRSVITQRTPKGAALIQRLKVRMEASAEAAAVATAAADLRKAS